MSGAAATAGRVLHVVPTLFDADGALIGGAERYVLELARHMAEEVPTTLVSFGERDEEREVGKLRLRVLGGAWHVRGQPFNPLHPRLPHEIGQADVVHFHQTHVLASSLGALWCRATGRRAFTTELGGGGWDLSAYLPTDRWYRAHLHISQYSRSVYGHEGRPWARVILGGVDTDKFSPDPSTPRRDFVLFVGRLLPHKGVDDLIRAIPPDLPLEIIGRPHDPEFLRRLSELARGKQVRFRHGCDDAALVQAYREALCVVLPSVYRPSNGTETQVPELLGQTLLEGMACGTPAICTDVASMPEIVQDGVTGWVVPPNDPDTLGERLRHLRCHPERARDMGRAARAVVQEAFTWPAVVRRCLEAYAA